MKSHKKTNRKRAREKKIPANDWLCVFISQCKSNSDLEQFTKMLCYSDCIMTLTFIWRTRCARYEIVFLTFRPNKRTEHKIKYSERKKKRNSHHLVRWFVFFVRSIVQSRWSWMNVFLTTMRLDGTKCMYKYVFELRFYKEGKQTIQKI